MTPTSLYECPACHRVYRHDAGKSGLKCLCEALPLGSNVAHPLDPPPFGPQRPYYADREHQMVELPDDGRDVEDLRDVVWIA